MFLSNRTKKPINEKVISSDDIIGLDAYGTFSILKLHILKLNAAAVPNILLFTARPGRLNGRLCHAFLVYICSFLITSDQIQLRYTL